MTDDKVSKLSINDFEKRLCGDLLNTTTAPRYARNKKSTTSSKYPLWCNSRGVPALYRQVENMAKIQPDSQQLDTARLFPILVSSGLSNTTLGAIWESCSREQPGSLNVFELYMCLALVSLCQNGQQADLGLLYQLRFPPVPRLAALLPPSTSLVHQQGPITSTECQNIPVPSTASAVPITNNYVPLTTSNDDDFADFTSVSVTTPPQQLPVLPAGVSSQRSPVPPHISAIQTPLPFASLSRIVPQPVVLPDTSFVEANFGSRDNPSASSVFNAEQHRVSAPSTILTSQPEPKGLLNKDDDFDDFQSVPVVTPAQQLVKTSLHNGVTLPAQTPVSRQTVNDDDFGDFASATFNLSANNNNSVDARSNNVLGHSVAPLTSSPATKVRLMPLSDIGSIVRKLSSGTNAATTTTQPVTSTADDDEFADFASFDNHSLSSTSSVPPQDIVIKSNATEPKATDLMSSKGGDFVERNHIGGDKYAVFRDLETEVTSSVLQEDLQPSLLDTTLDDSGAPMIANRSADSILNISSPTPPSSSVIINDDDEDFGELCSPLPLSNNTSAVDDDVNVKQPVIQFDPFADSGGQPVKEPKLSTKNVVQLDRLPSSEENSESTNDDDFGNFASAKPVVSQSSAPPMMVDLKSTLLAQFQQSIGTHHLATSGGLSVSAGASGDATPRDASQFNSECVSVCSLELSGAPDTKSVLSLDLKMSAASDGCDDTEDENGTGTETKFEPKSDKYSAFRDLMFADLTETESTNSEDECLDKWLRCLQECRTLLHQAAAIFDEKKVSGHLVSEVFATDVGQDYVKNIYEVYSVSRRIHLAAKLTGKLTDDVRQLCENAESSWSSVVALAKDHVSLEPLNLSDSRQFLATCESSKSCGVCLLSVEQTVGAPSLCYGPRQYHASCANFWMNCVRGNTLPALSLPHTLM